MSSCWLFAQQYLVSVRDALSWLPLGPVHWELGSGDQSVRRSSLVLAAVGSPVLCCPKQSCFCSRIPACWGTSQHALRLLLSTCWHSDFAAPEDITSCCLCTTSKIYLFKSSSLGALAIEVNETPNWWALRFITELQDPFLRFLWTMKTNEAIMVQGWFLRYFWSKVVLKF